MTMSPAVAHALEYPENCVSTKNSTFRSSRSTIRALRSQGAAEAAVIVAALALLVVAPPGSTEFWLIAAALAAPMMVQVIVSTMTQPVNSFWLKETELSSHSLTPGLGQSRVTGSPHEINGSGRNDCSGGVLLAGWELSKAATAEGVIAIVLTLGLIVTWIARARARGNCRRCAGLCIAPGRS
jgi:hypothetical protein